MSNHITIIDVQIGQPGKYAIRIGQEVSPKLRLANCYNITTGTLVKIAGLNYAENQEYTPFNNLNDAIIAAKKIKNSYINYNIRIDCTIS